MGLTTVADTLWLADGTAKSGSIVATPAVTGGWKGGDGRQLIALGIAFTVAADGSFSQALEPNDTATPSNIWYNVTIIIGTLQWSEKWIIPTSVSTVNLDDVRQVVGGTPGATALTGINDTRTTILYTNAAFHAAATTVSITLFSLPSRAILQGVIQQHSARFLGTAGTVTISVGDGSNATAYALAFDITQVTGSGIAGSNLELKVVSGALIATFTAPSNFGNGTVTNLTSGSVDINVLWKALA